MMPVAHVMSLYRKHTGQKSVSVPKVPDALDVTASRTGDRIFLHVVNTNRTNSIGGRIAVEGMTIKSGRIFEITEDPEFEVIDSTRDKLSVTEKNLPGNRQWTFPPASVSAVELDVEIV